jgi:hypothetical protein
MVVAGARCGVLRHCKACRYDSNCQHGHHTAAAPSFRSPARQRQQHQRTGSVARPAQPGPGSIVMVMAGVLVLQLQVAGQQVGVFAVVHGKAHGHRAGCFEDGVLKAVGSVRLWQGHALGGAGLDFDLGAHNWLVAGVTVQVHRHDTCVHDADQLEQV